MKVREEENSLKEKIQTEMSVAERETPRVPGQKDG